MISHKHKCIFIHISKCAGTSIEKAFGINTSSYLHADHDQLFGWDENLKLHLQHATPQQLIDLNLISKDQWSTYYKFIVYRNSWDKLLSDYFWTGRSYKIEDSFKNYLKRKGKFSNILNNTQNHLYCGNHLALQKDYFYLNGQKIVYDAEINFDSLQIGLNRVIEDLNLNSDFFNVMANVNPIKKNHYSYYYNWKTRNLVSRIYKEDIDFFRFKFEYKNIILKYFNKYAIK
ncbi:hypothetical protein FJ651_02245 [Paucihalobacter ruber]|uniref:Sulfotransferase family protein n=1 Tax=Paucihalobacter ruber TaxID=2567861 RepID=A0A506PR51_9FLAO|nr:sulfotransferase family 2 domain-containing protein [Paucihalobacter ruber]TPV35757.1 hypothetical protein FJ651_02245 [Paucihalobacter ruber]